MKARVEAIAAVLPQVRRYAQALTGSPERGDRYTRHFIDVVLADPGLVDGRDTKAQAFRVFHRACRGLTPVEDPPDCDARDAAPHERQIRLLVSLAGFPHSVAAGMIDAGARQELRSTMDPRSDRSSARVRTRGQ
jgi:hypothetical protein